MAPQAKTRKGPTESATQFPVRTKRKGNDGKMWVAAETKTGIRRWQRVKVDAPRTSVRVWGTHHIFFCEPYTTSGPLKSRYPLQGGVKFEVPDAFYPVLLRVPKKYRSRSGNAYIFGKRFPLDQYVRLGSHGNDGAQTGFIDLDKYDPNWAKGGEDIFGAYKPKYNWDDRAALRKVRAAVPHILFVGKTQGGDVGADLYAHKTRGKIDSLIIDNDHFFEEK